MHTDPYLNTDAGTMSPFEHGEVFVLDDGGEVSHQYCRQLFNFCGLCWCLLLSPEVANTLILVVKKNGHNFIFVYIG